MTRPLRLEHEGAIWHVTSRGNERRDIFRDRNDRSTFIEILGNTVVNARWRLYAYVLMSNHYHLLIETPERTLSRGVKQLNETWAQHFNWRHARVGHLFQGRFKGILVEREAHLLELVRYIVLNPVRCGAVSSAADYEWSNYRATASLEPAPEWLDVDWTLAQFDADRDIALEKYRAFVDDARANEYQPWPQLSGEIYLGTSAFCEAMQSLIAAREVSRDVPACQRQLVRTSFNDVVRAVCLHFGEPADAIRIKNRRWGRKALAQLAREECVFALREIGTFLGANDSATSKLAAAGRALEQVDQRYAEAIAKARAELSKVSGSDPT
jgi:putative transposase